MTADDDWRRFRTSGDPAALGAVFDAVSPELFRVALSLAHDAASAEDALQETWLVALGSAERHDPSRPVVPWLAGILRRKILEGRRRSRSPDARRLTRAPAAPDPSLVAELTDEELRLRAAIDALPKPYRDVAVLRWRYGLEPGEIADARGMPPGTVRSLLHRALARLRKSMRAAPALFLGARWPRGLDEVKRAVLRAAPAKPALGAAALAGGVLVAKTTKTAVLVAFACLLLGAGAVVQMGRGPEKSVRDSSDAIVSAAHEPPATTPRVRPAEAADETRPDVAAEKPFARGIVVDEAGTPIAACRVLVRGHEQMAEVQDAPVRLEAPAAAVTGADGRFVVPKKPDDLASLTFVADGYEAVEERSFDADLRVVLAPSGSFEARVVDTEGQPIAGADVRVIGAWVKTQPRWTNVWLRAATDDSGRFAFRSLPKEARLASVSAWGYRLPGPQMNFLQEQDVYVLERSCLIVDVTDATTHAPIENAGGLLVGADGSFAGALESQPAIASTPARAGRLFWSRSSIRSDATVELRVFALGHRTRTMPLAISAGSEPPLLAIALDRGEEAPLLAGRIESGAGALVEARFVPSSPGRKIAWQTDAQLPVAAATTAAADGSFAIAGIAPGRYRLVVTRADEVPLALEVEAPATSLELRFAPRAALTVRYVDPRGATVSGAWIHVESPGKTVSWCERTNDDGVVVFPALPAAEVVVLPVHTTGIFLTNGVADLAAMQPLPSVVRTLAAGSRETVELTRPDPCHVTVIVRDEAGHAVADVEVRAKTAYGYGFWLREERDRLPSLDLTTDAEGRVSFDVLPCRGDVKALRQGRVNSAKFVAEIGSSPTVEIVLPGITGIIRGRVLERGTGVPVTARPVKVWWDGKVIAETATGDDGRFVASGVPAGKVTVSVQGMTDANDIEGRRVDPKSPYGSAQFEFVMTPGEEHVVALSLPRIKGTSAELGVSQIDTMVVDAAGAASKGSWVSVRGLIDGAWCSLGDAQTDDAGHARLAVVAAERYRVTAWSGTRRTEVERDAAATIAERLTLPNE